MSMEEQAIRDRINDARQKLAGLRQDLDSVDGELESLSSQRHHYQLLDRACGSLEELDQLGAVKLFWGQSSDLDRTAEHVKAVRQRVQKFAAHVAGIEQRRQSIVDQIEARNESVGVLGDDLIDALEEEESRKAEWIIEREEGAVPYRAQVMPWVRGVEEDWRFRRSLGASMTVALLLAFVIQLIDLPIPERAELIEVPERVAKLIREERQRPVPPPPVIEEPVPHEQEPEPLPDPLLAEETPPEPRPEPVAEPVPQETRQASAKEQVQSKGILAFRESFASLAQSKPSAQLGSQARLGNAGDATVGRPERSMVTTPGAGSSGGINLASISRNVGGGGGQQITGVQITQVASAIGGSGGGADRPLSGGQSGGRTDEEIQIVFDRYKASLYRLYNRELRNDPTIRGQVVIRLTIEPDGSVSLCQLESSDMGAPALAEQVLDRIRGFDFGAKDGIVAMTIIYPIDFLPAA
jgi:outer membrane biosynthesis protein TonB